MFNLFKKSKYKNDQIISPADVDMFSIEKVNDPLFSKKIMGDGVAFKLLENVVTICSPINGKIVSMFPTGHAFGVISNNGTEILVHIGIDTVMNKGEGFTVIKKQGDIVKAGDAIVEVDVGKLKDKYDMTTMLIFINMDSNNITINKFGKYNKGEIIGMINE